MITGTGIDIVSIDRIRKNLTEHGNRFIEKILSEEEIKKIPSSGREEYIAGRFAVKEALFKASGTVLSFSRITVLNDVKGRPYIAEIPDVMQNKKVHISITHDTGYAAASVIIEE